MSKKMLINATHPEENRVAIVKDGILTELDIEVAGREPTKGNIYKAVVVRVETGLQAAFVDYGAERLGFLQIDEVNFSTVKPEYKPESGRSRTRINDVLHRGQELLVQITKEERGTKGAALTTYLSLAGRYMVLMPESQTRGVSRKAENDAQRKQLKKAMNSLEMPEGFGYIVRTAALDQTREELERDYLYLKRLHESISSLVKTAKAPALLYKESNLVIRSIRDYFNTEMDEVLVDDPDVFKEAKEFFEMVMPDSAKLVKLHQERRPIFSRYQIEDQIETISKNKVPLPSGGSIVIDSTEALVAIDVNSGKSRSEQGVEATATKTNLEAAEEVGRQLRLRDLGGLVVIDFIDMRERKNNRKVENMLKDSLSQDKARVSVGKISQFGLLEMSRQRIKAALTEGGAYLTCDHCEGSGRVKSPDTLAVALLRRIHTGIAKGQVSQVEAELHLDVASYLLNNKRDELLEMERRYNTRIQIHGHPDFLTEQVEVEFHKREKETSEQSDFVEAGVPLLIAEEETKDATESADGAEGGEPTRKRRRRRRRKPASERTTSEGQEQQGEEESATAADTEQEAPVKETQAADGSEDKQDETVEKRPRRRRSRRSSKAAEGTPESAGKTAPATEANTTQDDATSEEPPSPAVEKPKRRGGRRKATEGKAEAAPDTAAAEPKTVETTENNQETDEKSKPSRRRRSPRKKTEAQPVEQTAAPEQSITTPEASVSENADAAPVAEESRPKRRRAPRKKKTEEVSVDPQTTEAPASTVAETVKTEPATEEAVKKPVRKRAPRKKKTEDEPSSPKQESANSVETGAKPTEEKKPTRRTPRRKAPASPDAPPESVATDTAQTATDPVAEEAKPKRRRAPRKKKPAEEPEITPEG